MLKRTLLPLLSLCALTVAAAPPVVRNPKPLRVEGRPGVLLTGNFAGDAHPDLLLLEQGHSLQVLPANGTGPFAAPVVTLTPEETWNATAADIDGDGISDVFVTVPEDATVLLFRGVGDGTFTRGTSIPTFTLPGSVATGDVNGDGKLDLVVGSSRPHDANELAVFHGNGSGGFGPGVIVPFEGGGVLFVRDLNGDGKGDIVAGVRGAIAIYLSSGPSFAQSARLSVASGTAQPAMGDFNGDGKWDIVANSRVFKGNGDGTFTEGSTIPEPFGGEVRAVDADGDGKLDLIGGFPSGGAAFWRGKGDGTFAAPEMYVTDYLSDIGAGDFDRNGTIDIVLLGGYHETSFFPAPPFLAILRGTGGGIFDGNRMFAIRPQEGYVGDMVATNATAADMNGDGKPDIVARANRFHDHHVELAVMLNNGTGNLLPSTFTDLGESSWGSGPWFTVGDVNGDQKNDVVLVSNYAYQASARTYLGKGDGTFQAPVLFPVLENGAESSPTLADFSGDGTVDLMIREYFSAVLYLGAGNGTFHSPATFPLLADAIGDFNEDGRPDTIGSRNGSVTLGINNGSGGFNITYVNELDHRRFGDVGDFNGDGHLDYMLLDYDGMRVRMGNGNGTFGAPVDFIITPTEDRPVRARDFDGDGKLDVAIGSSVYLGNGDGTFHSYANVRTVFDRFSTVADFDGSGSPDLALTDYNSGLISIIRTRTGADPAIATTLSLVADPSSGVYAQQIKLTATRSENPLTPSTGAFLFKVNGVPVAMQLRNTISTELLRGFVQGTHTIAASYTGDDFYLPSSASTQVSIVRAQTSIQASSLGSRAYNRTFLVGAHRIAPVSSGLPGPTGPLSFREGTTTLSAKLTSGGYYEFAPSQLSVGTHTITVEYAGDANYEASSTTFQHVVTQAIPSRFVTTAPSENVMAGTTVRIKATIATGATGSITFYFNNTPIATRPISGGIAETSMVVPWGFHSFTASYAGDANWAAASNGASMDVLIGNWGTPLAIVANAGTGSSSLKVQWSRVAGGVSYTIYKKTSHAGAWEKFGVYDQGALGLSTHMTEGATWLFAVTATDANGNTTPMSTPDLATAVLLPAIAAGKRIEAVDVTQLRAGINAVRAFAGLAPYAFTASVGKGAAIRKDHVMEMRGALSQARAAIGLPLGFSDPTLTVGQTPVRALHFGEIRTGID